MKFFLGIMALVFCLSSCSKKQDATASLPFQEPGRTKKFTLRVYQMIDYSSPVYDSTYADVEIGAYKQSTVTGVRTYLWDTVLTRQRIRLFPTAAQPLTIVKNLPNIYDSKEWVRIYTISKYDNQGTNQVGGGVTPFAAGVDTLVVNVPL